MTAVYLGAVYDAMRLLGYRPEQFYINIKPMAGYSELISGPAFTTYGRVVSREEDYQALDNVRLEMYKKELFAAKPIVLLQANDSYVAHSGDITSTLYQALGAVGFITDGNVRDLDLIDKLNFPTFCRDANPIDAIDYWALTDYNVPLVIDGVAIHPGDMIYASMDGVIRVRKEDLKPFNAKLSEILEKETKARELIKELRNQENFTDALMKFVEKEDRW